MDISEMLLQIVNNEQTLIDELNDILTLQEELMNPKITFTFNGETRTILEKDAYWNDKFSFVNSSMQEELPIFYHNGYAMWCIYTIVDSKGNLIKYGESITDGEKYNSSLETEFTIKTDDGTSYLIRANGWMISSYSYLPDQDTRFSISDDYETVYFTPEMNGNTYKLDVRASDQLDINIIVNATLVEGGNK